MWHAGEEHVLTQFYSSRTLRHLVLGSADGRAVPFAEKLWSGVFDGRCQQYLGERALLSIPEVSPPLQVPLD